MIDLKNGYIKNDKGPLLRAWLDEANKQGLNPRGRDMAWFNEGFVFIHTVNHITNTDTCSDPQHTAGKTELTLKDFKPKQFKTEYVKVDMPSAEIAKAMIDGEIFYNKDGKRSYSWDGVRFVNHMRNTIEIVGAFYRKVETEIQWYENITKPVPCWVSDCGPHSKTRLKLVCKHIAHDKHPFSTVERTSWKYATPLTPEDLLQN